MKQKLFLITLFFICSTLQGYCNDRAEQNLSANLGEVLEISKIIVEGVEYDVDEALFNVKKIQSSKSSKSTAINLSPIRVKIHTNLSTPISVTAEFQELNHDENLHNFSQADLSFYPETIKINNPYDNVITDEFTPQVNVKPDAVKGYYTGQILFTLGAI